MFFHDFVLKMRSFWFVFYKCICKEGNRSVLANRFSFCAPLKVPRPILRKRWLGLEDKTIFQLKYQCVCPRCFDRFLKSFAKNWQKQWGQTHWYFNWKIDLSSRPSHVFRSMGRGTFSGAQMALLRQSIPSIVDFQLYFQKRDFDFFSVTCSIFRG